VGWGGWQHCHGGVCGRGLGPLRQGSHREQVRCAVAKGWCAQLCLTAGVGRRNSEMRIHGNQPVATYHNPDPEAGRGAGPRCACCGVIRGRGRCGWRGSVLTTTGGEDGGTLVAGRDGRIGPGGPPMPMPPMPHMRPPPPMLPPGPPPSGMQGGMGGGLGGPAGAGGTAAAAAATGPVAGTGAAGSGPAGEGAGEGAPPAPPPGPPQPMLPPPNRMMPPMPSLPSVGRPGPHCAVPYLHPHARSHDPMALQACLG
jgi:hypothetical protein